MKRRVQRSVPVRDGRRRQLLEVPSDFFLMSAYRSDRADDTRGCNTTTGATRRLQGRTSETAPTNLHFARSRPAPVRFGYKPSL